MERSVLTKPEQHWRGELFSRPELARIVIHFAPAHVCRRIKPSIHFYSVCGIKLPKLMNHLIAGDLGLRRVHKKPQNSLGLRTDLYSDK
jgi:hypothetical protein